MRWMGGGKQESKHKNDHNPSHMRWMGGRSQEIKHQNDHSSSHMRWTGAGKFFKIVKN